MRTLCTLTLTVLSACMLVPASAQPDKPNIDALRISWITKKLSLTPEEAQKFWPVFNEFEAELKKVREERRNLDKDVTDWSTKSEAEVKQHLDKLLELDQKELDLKKTYTARLYEVIPAYKVILLYKAVEEFRRWLIEKAQQRRPGMRME